MRCFTNANSYRHRRGQQHDDPKVTSRKAGGQQGHRGGAGELVPRTCKDSGQGGGGKAMGHCPGTGGPPKKSWFRIMIPKAKNYDRTWLLSALQGVCTVPFTPVQYRNRGRKIVFYVEGATTANALAKVSESFTDTEGNKVSIIMNPSLPPACLVNKPRPTVLEAQMPAGAPACEVSHSVEEIKRVILPFLHDYYSVYDSGDRWPLLEAYHDCASFTLNMPLTFSSLVHSLGSDHDRELKDPTTAPWFQLLKPTRQRATAFLNELPNTQHDISSFVVDVHAYTNTLQSFTVSGVFKEVDGECQDTVNAFSRKFITIPAANAGLCILRDNLYVWNATSEEIKRAFVTTRLRPSSSPVPTLTAAQQEMRSIFCLQSGMNPEWSQKCLQENDWDFDRAAQIFSQFQAKGQIPDVAFE